MVLIALTIAIHVPGVVAAGRALRSFLDDERHNRYFETAAGSILATVVITLWLALLHGFESIVWAVAYVKLGAMSSYADAVLYSVDSMVTRGSSGLALDREWRMMGAVEAGDGMLLFGISTAFLFYVMVRLYGKDYPLPGS